MSEPAHLITDKTVIAPLEGWRGVLSLLVVSMHFSLFLLGARLTPYGYLAVDFFFILSGFIIARQYEAGIIYGKVDFRKFAIRRIARLYPLYIVSIGMALYINDYVFLPNSPMRIQSFGFGPHYVEWLFMQLTMLSILVTLPQPNMPTWSVSAEWVVNLGFFWLVWRYRRISNTVLWMIVGAGACYMLGLSPQTLDNPAYRIAIVRGITGFCLGWLIFRYHRRFPPVRLWVLYPFEIGLAAVTMTLAWFHADLMHYCVDYVFELVIIPLLVIVSLYRYGIIGTLFSTPVMKFLGRISYSIYLWHVPLAYYIGYGPAMESMGIPWIGLGYIVLLINVATFSYVLIETPGRWLGRKLTRPSGNEAPTPFLPPPPAGQTHSPAEARR